MSKKKHKPSISSKKSLPRERPVPTAPLKERRPEYELIHFDLSAKIYVAVCLSLFFIFTGLKWHNSSIPYWNKMAFDGGSPDRGLLMGEARSIRSDEWLVVSSYILAQQKKGFPVSNESLGFGKSPLTAGLPTKSILSVMKPALWGYYFLDIERAFAWQWNFKTFLFLIISFLFLMLFTRNNFYISLFGSIWLLLSTAVQWWSINTEIFTYGLTSILTFLYILYAKKPGTILINGILFILSSYSFVMVLYPAYQVPFAYFLLALIIGFIVKNKSWLMYSDQLLWKISTLGVSLAALLMLGYLFYHEAKDTIDVIANTVYPGKRSEKGGGFSVLRLFTDNFSPFMSQKVFPVKWQNICELSSFLMLSPLAAILIIADYIKTRKTDLLLISVVIFQIGLAVWIFIGFPGFLAKWTLFFSSPSFRSFYVFGFANVIVTLLFLAHHKTSLLQKNILTKISLFVGIFIFAYWMDTLLNKQVDSFFTSRQTFVATLIFSCLAWLVIFFHEHKAFQIAFYGLCFLFIAPNIKINPLSVGLSPYYDNEIYKMVSTINAKDPQSSWAVFGSNTIATYIKAAGINCFNGVQFTPPLKKLQVLDPSMKNDSIYNRYAHIAFTSLINGQDSINFELRQADSYSIRMDPCSPRLEQMGINYFLFTYNPDPREVQCMHWLQDTSGMYVFKRDDL